MDAQKFADPGIWAEVGGLNGLVIFALFLALGFFLMTIRKIFEMQREDLKSVLEMQCNERREWSKLTDMRQQETNAVIRGLSEMIHESNMRSRRYDKNEG